MNKVQRARIEDIVDLWHQVPQLAAPASEHRIDTVKARFELDEDGRESFERLKGLVDLSADFEPVSDDDIEYGNAVAVRAEECLFREQAYLDLLTELVAMGKDAPVTRAIVLVTLMPREYRGSVANELVRLLMEHGRFSRVREAILCCSPDDGIMLALELFRAVRDPKILDLVMVLIRKDDRPAEDVSEDAMSRRCLHAKHMAALWKATGSAVHLLSARSRCRELQTYDQVTAWLHVSRQTWDPADFVDAFRTASTETDAESRAMLADRVITCVLQVIMPVTRRPDGDMIIANVAAAIDQRWRGQLLRRAAEIKAKVSPSVRPS